MSDTTHVTECRECGSEIDRSTVSEDVAFKAMSRHADAAHPDEKYVVFRRMTAEGAATRPLWSLADQRCYFPRTSRYHPDSPRYQVHPMVMGTSR